MASAIIHVLEKLIARIMESGEMAGAANKP